MMNFRLEMRYEGWAGMKRERSRMVGVRYI